MTKDRKPPRTSALSGDAGGVPVVTPRTKRPVLLAVAAMLWAAWLGFLLYLAFRG